MNEMVERVTQAVRAVRIPIMRGEDMIGVTQVPAHMAERIASAAIAAMREPTEAMVRKGAACDGEIIEMTGLEEDWMADVREQWRAMIDAALKSS